MTSLQHKRDYSESRAERITAGRHHLKCRKQMFDMIGGSIRVVEAARNAHNPDPRIRPARVAAREQVRWHRHMLQGQRPEFDHARFQRLLTRKTRIQAGKDAYYARYNSVQVLREVEILLRERKRNRTKWDLQVQP